MKLKWTETIIYQIWTVSICILYSFHISYSKYILIYTILIYDYYGSKLQCSIKISFELQDKNYIYCGRNVLLLTVRIFTISSHENSSLVLDFEVLDFRIVRSTRY